MADPSTDNSDSATPPSRAVAGSLAMAGFVVAVISGLIAGNPVETILGRGLASMLICLVIGMIVGSFCEAAVTEYLVSFVRNHPVPNSEIEVDDLALQMHAERRKETARDAAEISNDHDEIIE